MVLYNGLALKLAILALIKQKNFNILGKTIILVATGHWIPRLLK
jgi:hypothetical protein